MVAWLGAVQAQEYGAARWGLALRAGRDVTDADVERAFDAGEILRTHVMRPTWHFVPRVDIRWMLELTAPRVHARMAVYDRRLGLDTPLMVRTAGLIERALGDGAFLTRAELGAELKRGGIAFDSMRLAHAVMYAELEGVVCSGPRRGRHFTYAPLARRAPDAVRLDPDDALAELTRRYFRSHGPATARDFAWWSGLTMADVRRGLDIVRARHEDKDGRIYWRIGPRGGTTAAATNAHLLPVYDEYVVAYRDREAVPHAPPHVGAGPRAAITFQHPVVIAGQVAGTWRPKPGPSGVGIEVYALRRLSRSERQGVSEAAGRYGRFLNSDVSLSFG